MVNRRKIATYPIPQSLDDIPDVAVFPTDEARIAFEEKNILVHDLSQADNMYRTHTLEQVFTPPSYSLLTEWLERSPLVLKVPVSKHILSFH